MKIEELDPTTPENPPLESIEEETPQKTENDTIPKRGRHVQKKLQFEEMDVSPLYYMPEFFKMVKIQIYFG